MERRPYTYYRREYLEKRSEVYIVAVEALRLLYKEEGYPGIESASAEVLGDVILSEFIAREKVKLSGGRCSPLRLIEKHPRYDSEDFYFPGDDHGTLWIKKGKPHTYVTQPYPFGEGKMKKMVEYCERYNLNVTVKATSWHFHGATLRLDIERKKKK